MAGFGAFSTFWTTLAFHLAGPPFQYGSGWIGLFGLVGIVGALSAPEAGRIIDRRGARWTIGAGLTCILLAYIVIYGFGGTAIGMVARVILLDLGAQSAHISNQSRIYSIRPEARSRMNTAYMVTYFVGGAASSWAGAHSLGWRLPRGHDDDRGRLTCLRCHIGRATKDRESFLTGGVCEPGGCQ